MKRFLFLIMAVISLLCYSKDKPVIGDGIYQGYEGYSPAERFVIHNDTLDIYIFPIEKTPVDYPIYLLDNSQYILTAKCTMDKIGNDFIEINSTEKPYIEAFRNMTVSCEKTDSLYNKSEINFVFPNVHTPLEIRLSYGKRQNSSAITEKGRCKFILTPDTDKSDMKFSFEIYRVEYPDRTLVGQFLGVLHYSCLGKEIGYRAGKNITVTLPDMTDLLLEQFYIDGEYIQILPSGDLKWRGEKFKKLIHK